MNVYMRIGVFMLIAFTFAAQTQPAFSGVWQLNLAKSTLRIQAPTELLAKIDHQDPNLTQTMLIVAADGSEQQHTFTYETNGRESRTKIALGSTRRVRCNNLGPKSSKVWGVEVRGQ